MIKKNEKNETNSISSSIEISSLYILYGAGDLESRPRIYFCPTFSVFSKRA